MTALLPPSVAPTSTGAGVQIALIDSGINFGHPHVRGRPDGFTVAWKDDELVVRDGEFTDRYGHGTCCAGVLRALSSGAELLAVRVTGARATSDADRLAFAIEEVARRGVPIACVPLGTQTRLRGGLDRAVDFALGAGTVVVASDPANGSLPAECPGAMGVRLFDGVDVARTGDGHIVADGHPRPADGYPSNFYGPSLSAARGAAALARYAQLHGLRGAMLLSHFKNDLGVR